MMDDKVRGEYAGQILGNPVFVQACEVIKKEVIRAWADCPARDTEGKEYLWQLYRNTEKFENVFRGYIESGKLKMERDKQEQSTLQKVQDNVTKFFRR